MTATNSRQWRAVAFSTAVPAGKPVRISCGSDDYVLFRDATGVCRALIDRCAHRRAPLSLGRLTEDCLIECPYHGWRYDGASGACRTIPNFGVEEKVPKTYRVAAFETLERNGFIQLLLGNGDAKPAPGSLELPALSEQWQNERLLVYPEALFMETLVDSPSAFLSVPGLRILDDHRYGDPVVEGDSITVEYAAIDARRAKQLAQKPVADFPYMLRLSASKMAAKIELYADANLVAAIVLVAVAAGARVTRLLWRGSRHVIAKSLTIECATQIDPLAVSASNHYVSRAWSGALQPAMVG